MHASELKLPNILAHAIGIRFADGFRRIFVLDLLRDACALRCIHSVSEECWGAPMFKSELLPP